MKKKFSKEEKALFYYGKAIGIVGNVPLLNSICDNMIDTDNQAMMASFTSGLQNTKRKNIKSGNHGK